MVCAARGPTVIRGAESTRGRTGTTSFSFSIWLAKNRTRRAISSTRRISPTNERWNGVTLGFNYIQWGSVQWNKNEIKVIRTSLNWTFPSSPSSETASWATSVGTNSCTKLIASEPVGWVPLQLSVLKPQYKLTKQRWIIVRHGECKIRRQGKGWVLWRTAIGGLQSRTLNCDRCENNKHISNLSLDISLNKLVALYLEN